MNKEELHKIADELFTIVEEAGYAEEIDPYVAEEILVIARRLSKIE